MIAEEVRVENNSSPCEIKEKQPPPANTQAVETITFYSLGRNYTDINKIFNVHFSRSYFSGLFLCSPILSEIW